MKFPLYSHLVGDFVHHRNDTDALTSVSSRICKKCLIFIGGRCSLHTNKDLVCAKQTFLTFFYDVVAAPEQLDLEGDEAVVVGAVRTLADLELDVAQEEILGQDRIWEVADPQVRGSRVHVQLELVLEDVGRVEGGAAGSGQVVADAAEVDDVAVVHVLLTKFLLLL